MRYPAKHKQATRERILAKAGALAKQQGFGTTGVDALMAAAGLTAGGFYAHFGSKSELLSALIERELVHSQARFDVDSDAALAQAVQAYLSLAHVEHPQRGCPLTSLSSEIARADDTVRQTYEDRLLALHQRVSAHTRDADAAWSLIAQAVGAVTLARAMRSRAARKAVLDGVSREVLALLEREAG